MDDSASADSSTIILKSIWHLIQIDLQSCCHDENPKSNLLLRDLVPVCLYLLHAVIGAENGAVSSHGASHTVGGIIQSIKGGVGGLKVGQPVCLILPQDTIIESVKNGPDGFSFKRRIVETDKYQVSFGDDVSVDVYWGADVIIAGNLKTLGSLVVTGSPTTNEVNAYQRDHVNGKRNQLIELYQNTERLRSVGDTGERYRWLMARNIIVSQSIFVDAENYVRQHPASFFSLTLLD